MINSIKYLLILLFIYHANAFADKPPANRATGFFIAFGVGPRMPIGEFANTTDIGYGLNVEFSYTDNEFLPVFLYANIGYEQYPGSQNFFQETQYSNYHTNALPVNYWRAILFFSTVRKYCITYAYCSSISFLYLLSEAYRI